MYTDRIALGSGTLYAVLYSGTIPNDATIETDTNKLGDIQGGASLEYKATYYDAIDDSGKRTKTILTDEEATLKSGVMTWNGNTLKKLCATARVTETSLKRTVKIGGIDMQDGLKYVIRFVHTDAVDGDCKLTIVGSNRAGLAMAFAKNKETVINAEFKAFPSDTDGTLITYEEDILDYSRSALFALSTGTLTLSPAFNSDTLEYTGTTTSTSMNIVPALVQADATIIKTYSPPQGGTQTFTTNSVPLSVGINVIHIKVTYGINTRQYNITITCTEA